MSSSRSWRTDPESCGSSVPATSTERMHIVVTGHVDHGKSTIIGRLLADIGSIPKERLDSVRLVCERSGKRFEHAFLLDALKDERAQGITIDAARVFFKTGRRDYVILDAPGHEEFLKNMVTGASRAEAGLLVIDAFEGLRENSRRHGFMLSMLGISQIAVLVNKMDLVDYSREVFDRLVTECRQYLARIGVTPTWFIPVSALRGENLTAAAASLAWYEGPTVLDALDAFTNRPRPTAAVFRMPVQGVYKFAGHSDGRRIVAGTVESGRISTGDEIIFYPSGKKSRIKRIEAFHSSPRREISAEEAAGFTLSEQIYIERGEMAALSGQVKPHVGTTMRVSLFWLGKYPLVPGKEYVLKLGTGRAPFRVQQIHRVLDASSLTPKSRPARVNQHEVAECTLDLRRPIAFDTVDQCPATARFVILDGFDISGGGIVREARRAVTNSKFEPAVLWLTGLSGAGKSTIAREIYARARHTGARVEFLDGDEIRNLFPHTGFSRADRDAHVRRVGFLASRLEHHGVFVICALISPYAESRAFVRGLCNRFIEVHVSTPLHECEHRDVKGLYRRARRGEIAGFTGLEDPYEPPIDPEARIDTTALTVSEAVDDVMRAIAGNRSESPSGNIRPAKAGW
jgi:bifunctional enzyme CysN/CysC